MKFGSLFLSFRCLPWTTKLPFTPRFSFVLLRSKNYVLDTCKTGATGCQETGLEVADRHRWGPQPSVSRLRVLILLWKTRKT